MYFKYIFFNITHFYLNHTQHGLKNISIVLPKNSCYFAVLHVRFSTVFFSSQLVDLFSYELPIVNSNAFIQKDNKISSHTALSNNSNSILVYNFHNLMFQERFFFFCVDLLNKSYSFTVNSISELFPNASWLEREVSELHGSVFSNKKDLRNLMLQYGDMSTPFRKSAPSIGVKEFFYDSINDKLMELPLTLQS